MYTKTFNDIPITFSKSKKAKRVIIRLKPFQEVRVSVPFYSSYTSAEKFVHKKLLWIDRSLKKIKEIEKQKVSFKINDFFATKKHKVIISDYSGLNIAVKKEGNVARVLVPKDFNIDTENVQKEIKNRVVDVLRDEAKEELPVRLSKLAQMNELNFKKVSIRNNKTRWGSCSFNNNISLNLHLMRLPDDLIDYVLLHELAHTKVKNHSKDFWIFLESICPNSKLLDKNLRSYNVNW